MAIHDRPYFESQRERERGYRERERSSGRRDFGRRDFGRRDDDDDRGSFMSRDRDEFEQHRDRDRDPFDPREEGFRGRQSFEDYDPRGGRQFAGERQRFEQFEDWERPREQREFGSQQGFRPSGGSEHAGYRSSGVGPRGLPNRAGGGREGGSFERGSLGEGSWGGLRQQGRFAGRGPKGYQRSDERLKEEVCERLTADADIDAVEIEILVQDGEVTLQGSVPEREMKRAAEDSAEEISGVKQVHNRLRVEPRQGDDDERSQDRFTPKSSEGQRSSAGRKAH
jgi:BON domain